MNDTCIAFYVGQIFISGYNFPPVGTSFCNGQVMSINQHTALFSLLGTTYGGDGKTDFHLPDFRGRIPVHRGQGPPVYDRKHNVISLPIPNPKLGSKGGTAKDHKLSIAELPVHSHTPIISQSITVGDDSSDQTGNPNGHWLGSQTIPPKQGIYRKTKGTGTMGGVDGIIPEISDTGDGRGFSLMNPYLTLNFCIALEGIYPSRN